jgi:hypothetical protein
MRFLYPFLIILLLAACGHQKKEPNIPASKIPLQTIHFEQFLFNNDTLFKGDAISSIQNKYSTFGNIFLGEIVNIDPRWPVDTAISYVKGFRDAYQSVYDSTMILYKDFTPYVTEIQDGMRWFKSFFPQYKIPKQIITYVGPLDGYGDLIMQDALAIGLHHHLGSNHTLYQSAWLQETYPKYISRRFDPSTISVNAMTNLILDLHPENLENKTLAQQMIEKGKRLYLLQQLLPEKEPHWLIGYTEKQFADCLEHEKEIWNLFIQNQLLQETNFVINKNYIEESPKTQELGESSPGNIGSFVGWQIVSKFMKKNPETSMQTLMKMDADKIMQEARYKP